MTFRFSTLKALRVLACLLALGGSIGSADDAKPPSAPPPPRPWAELPYRPTAQPGGALAKGGKRHFSSGIKDLSEGAPVTGDVHEFSTEVTSHAESYVIPVGGTVTPSNEYVRLENIGETAVVGPKVLVKGGSNWSTIDSILAAATEGASTDRERALALWQFARVNRYHWYPPTDHTLEDVDPVKLFSVYGYGFCTNVAAVLAALWERAGMPARFWTIGPNGEHQVSEAYFDGSWHLLDADRDGLYLKWDNDTVAGVEDLIADSIPRRSSGARPCGSG